MPGAKYQTVRNRDESFASFVFDDLHERKLWPVLQARTPSPLRMDWVSKDLLYCLRPPTKTIRRPQNRACATGRSIDALDHPAHQRCVTFGAHLTPDEQSGKDTDRRGEPDSAMLCLDTEFITLHLTRVNLPLTYQLGLDPLRMAPSSLMPRRDRPFIQPKRCHNCLHRTTVRQQRQIRNHQPLGIMRPEQRAPLCLHKGPFAHTTAQSSLFLRMYPDSLLFPTRWTRHHACIQRRFCHKLQFRESASSVLVDSSYATKNLQHSEALSLLTPRYFVVLP